MLTNSLPYISTAIQEILSAMGLPGTALVSHALSSFEKNRQQQARDILLKRIQENDAVSYEDIQKDELIGTIHLYANCAAQGAARANLDLLAQAFAGAIKNRSLTLDNFHKHINILSSLTRDEILVIGTYLRFFRHFQDAAEKDSASFWGTIKPNAWSAAMESFVPSFFPTTEHVSVICGSLTRTGLTLPQSPQLGLSPSHSFTVLLDEVSKLIDFEKAHADYPEY